MPVSIRSFIKIIYRLSPRHCFRLRVTIGHNGIFVSTELDSFVRSVAQMCHDADAPNNFKDNTKMQISQVFASVVAMG